MAIPLNLKEQTKAPDAPEATIIKKQITSLGWLWKLMLVLVVITCLITVALYFWLKQRLQPDLRNLQEQLITLSADEKVAQAGRFVVVQEQLQILKDVLTNHVYPTNVFKLVEGFTHRRVFFKSMSINLPAHSIDLSGVAASFQVMAEQIKIFENQPNIQKFEIAGPTLNPEGLSFQVKVVFNPSILRK